MCIFSVSKTIFERWELLNFVTIGLIKIMFSRKQPPVPPSKIVKWSTRSTSITSVRCVHRTSVLQDPIKWIRFSRRSISNRKLHKCTTRSEATTLGSAGGVTTTTLPVLGFFGLIIMVISCLVNWAAHTFCGLMPVLSNDWSK